MLAEAPMDEDGSSNHTPAGSVYEGGKLTADGDTESSGVPAESVMSPSLIEAPSSDTWPLAEPSLLPGHSLPADPSLLLSELDGAAGADPNKAKRSRTRKMPPPGQWLVNLTLCNIGKPITN